MVGILSHPGPVRTPSGDSGIPQPQAISPTWRSFFQHSSFFCLLLWNNAQTTCFCPHDKDSRTLPSVSREHRALLTPSITKEGNKGDPQHISLLALEVLNGAQTLKGALYHDGQSGTQSLTFFHAVGQERGSKQGRGGAEPSSLPTCYTPAPGNLLPVGCEDHSSPFSDDAHNGVPQHAACLGVHARGGFILWGGREGRELGLEPASPGYCTLLGCPPLSSSALWQTIHKVPPQVGKIWGIQALGRESRGSTRRVKRHYAYSLTPFSPRMG